MRRLAYAVLLPAGAFALACTTADAAITITVDKTSQRMTVAQDSRTLYSWPVSTGKRGYATPSGDFRAFRMEKDHFSREWDEAPMPHSIFFTKKGHAIHGSLETRRLGSPASHGCVRLAPEHAATLFRLVQADGVLNTQVVIAGEEPRMQPAMPVARAAPRNEAEDGGNGGSQYYRQRGYAQPPAYDPRYGYDNRRYSYEDAPPPAYYRQPGLYGRPYYAQPQYPPRYRQPYPYDDDQPAQYYRRGYGWN
jgi:hypothetical protein